MQSNNENTALMSLLAIILTSHHACLPYMHASSVYSPATKCVALARVGQATQKIAYGSMADLLTEDMVGIPDAEPSNKDMVGSVRAES